MTPDLNALTHTNASTIQVEPAASVPPIRSLQGLEIRERRIDIPSTRKGGAESEDSRIPLHIFGKINGSD